METFTSGVYVVILILKLIKYKFIILIYLSKVLSINQKLKSRARRDCRTRNLHHCTLICTMQNVFSKLFQRHE